MFIQEGLVEERSELELKVNSLAAALNIRPDAEGAYEYKNFHGNDVIGAYLRIESQNWGLIMEAGCK